MAKCKTCDYVGELLVDGQCSTCKIDVPLNKMRVELLNPIPPVQGLMGVLIKARQVCLICKDPVCLAHHECPLGVLEKAEGEIMALLGEPEEYNKHFTSEDVIKANKDWVDGNNDMLKKMRQRLEGKDGK